jgi:flagellar FliL protein
MNRIAKVAIAVVIQGALAWALVVFVAGPRMRHEPFAWQKIATEEEVEAEDPRLQELGPLLPIEEVLVNVAGTKGRRFFKTSLSLEVRGKDLEKLAPERMPILRGKVIDVLSRKSMDELTEPSARDSLPLELLKSLNAEVTGGEFSNLFFTEFLVQ